MQVQKCMEKVSHTRHALHAAWYAIRKLSNKEVGLLATSMDKEGACLPINAPISQRGVRQYCPFVVCVNLLEGGESVGVDGLTHLLGAGDN